MFYSYVTEKKLSIVFFQVRNERKLWTCSLSLFPCRWNFFTQCVVDVVRTLCFFVYVVCSMFVQVVLLVSVSSDQSTSIIEKSYLQVPKVYVEPFGYLAASGQ